MDRTFHIRSADLDGRSHGPENLGASLLPPSLAHLLGTDNLGRDVLLRIINGASIDLQIGLFTVLPALTVGSLVGALAGYYGSLADLAVMRLVDIVVTFPFVLVIAIVAVLGPGLFNMYIAVGLVGWVSYARVVRAEMMVAKQMDYARAARVLGFSDARILLRHLIPNVIVQALIYSTSDFILWNSLGQLARLPWPRRPAASPRMGRDDRRGLQLPCARPLDGSPAGTGHRRAGCGFQPVR